MTPGTMFQFRGLHTLHPLNSKYGLYLGKDYIQRSDGITVRNHKILMVGEKVLQIIDDNLINYMKLNIKC